MESLRKGVLIFAVLSILGLLGFYYNSDWGPIYDHGEGGYRNGFPILFNRLSFLFPLLSIIFCLKKGQRNLFLISSIIGMSVFLLSLIFYFSNNAYGGLDWLVVIYSPTLLLSICFLILYKNIKTSTDNEVTPKIKQVQRGNISTHQDFTEPPPLSNAVLIETPPPLHIGPHSIESTYYIVLNEKQMGPYDLDKMKVLMEVGQLNMHTLVWKEGMADWDEAQALPDLLELLK